MANSDHNVEASLVVAVFSSHSKAEQALEYLHAAGVKAGEITVLTQGVGDAPLHENMRNAAGIMRAKAGAHVGSVFGGAFGSVAGMLSGLGTAAIPGAGPEVGSGVLATTIMGLLTGAAVGGLLGALLSLGPVDDEAARLVEHTANGAKSANEGDIIVTVRPGSVQESRAESILMAHKPDRVWVSRKNQSLTAGNLSSIEEEKELEDKRMGVDTNSVTGTQDAVDPETGALGTAGTPMTAGYGVSGSTAGTGTAREGNPYRGEDYIGATPDSPAYESGGRSSDDAGDMPGVQREEPNVEEKYAQKGAKGRDTPRTDDIYGHGPSYSEGKGAEVTTPKTDLYAGAAVDEAPSYANVGQPDGVQESAGTDVLGTQDPRGLGDNTDES